MTADPAKQLAVMPVHIGRGMTRPIVLQRSIGPGRPVGGDGGNGGGCMPGLSLLDLSLVMDPNTLFVTVGTQVQLSGGATVRRWLPDCSTHDENAPVQWSLYYQPIGGGGTSLSILAAPSDSPITLPKAVITQTGTGSGILDLSAGTIETQLQAAVQARYNGTVSITLSTGAAITPCDGTSRSGSAVSNGTAALVGDAPVDGPPGTTHCWLDVNANLTPVGYS